VTAIVTLGVRVADERQQALRDRPELQGVGVVKPDRAVARHFIGDRGFARRRRADELAGRPGAGEERQRKGEEHDPRGGAGHIGEALPVLAAIVRDEDAVVAPDLLRGHDRLLVAAHADRAQRDAAVGPGRVEDGGDGADLHQGSLQLRRLLQLLLLRRRQLLRWRLRLEWLLLHGRRRHFLLGEQPWQRVAAALKIDPGERPRLQPGRPGAIRLLVRRRRRPRRGPGWRKCGCNLRRRYDRKSIRRGNQDPVAGERLYDGDGRLARHLDRSSPKADRIDPDRLAILQPQAAPSIRSNHGRCGRPADDCGCRSREAVDPYVPSAGIEALDLHRLTGCVALVRPRIDQGHPCGSRIA
jgi:hypothetical protein